MRDDAPDYSRYTLAELHDVARRVNKQLYPDRYALILQELEKRAPSRPAVTELQPQADKVPLRLVEGCLLPIIRLVGGFMVATYTAVFLTLPYENDLAFFWGLGGGFYFAFFQREKTYSPGDPVTLSYFFQKALLTLVYGVGGASLAYVFTFVLAMFLMPSDSPDLIPGISNIDTMTYLLNGSVVLGVAGALWLWIREKER